MTFDVMIYDVMKYDIMKYDVMKYDFMKYDVMRYDVMKPILLSTPKLTYSGRMELSSRRIYFRKLECLCVCPSVCPSTKSF